MNTINKITFTTILSAIFGVVLGIYLASSDYLINIKPSSVSGSDLRVIPVYRGDVLLDVLVTEKMRELIDYSDFIEIPIETSDNELGDVLNHKFDSLKSFHQYFYSFNQ